MRRRFQPPIAFRSGPPQVRSRVSLTENALFCRDMAARWTNVLLPNGASAGGAGEIRRSASGARVCRGHLDNRGQYRAIGISSVMPQVPHQMH